MKGDTMSIAELKSFAEPDEVRRFPEGKLELVRIGGAVIGRATLEPGWRWATSVQPIAKGEGAQKRKSGVRKEKWGQDLKI
jgi:hypothetical protein